MELNELSCLTELGLTLFLITELKHLQSWSRARTPRVLYLSDLWTVLSVYVTERTVDLLLRGF